MKLSAALLIGAVALGSPGLLLAQERGKPSANQPQHRERKGNADVPSDQRPPAGMCRIWLENVPAAQQPAPTDCATAVRNRPEKGRVIFGDDYVPGKKRDTTAHGKPVMKGFAPPTHVRKPPIRRP